MLKQLPFSIPSQGQRGYAPIRYSACWEDAEVLLKGLNVHPGDRCLSIASGGDNTLALLLRDPAQVVALDSNPAQIALLELRVAAYRALAYPALLELLGMAPGRRFARYRACREYLSPSARFFWDAQPHLIRRGLHRIGRFDRYLAVAGQELLPRCMGSQRVAALFAPRSRDERVQFYAQQWNTPAWRSLLRLTSSRGMLQRFGRDRAFFTYANEREVGHIAERLHYILTELDPACNPYLQAIALRVPTVLPLALRPASVEHIRRNLDRLTWHTRSLEAYVQQCPPDTFQCFNLSNVFEYMSVSQTRLVQSKLLRAGTPGARLLYWNMLVPRDGSGAGVATAHGRRVLHPDVAAATQLLLTDRVPFYQRVVLETIQEVPYA